LTADKHYIALDPDLANLSDAIARFRDPNERRRSAEAAHALVTERHTYRDRMAALHQMICTSGEIALEAQGDGGCGD
jgi:hypothetical protein